MERIAWFRKLKPDSVLLVGKKASELNNLYTRDFPVSPGFIITTDAFRDFFSVIENKVILLLRNLSANDEKQIANAAREIQKMIFSTKITGNFEKELEEAYDSMDIPIAVGKGKNIQYFLETKQKAKVLVRSSPVSLNPESILETEFPAYLNVEGIEQLKRAIKACWAAVYSPNSIKHRIENDFKHHESYNAVIIQKMVQSEKSGIAYTKNPADSNTKEIVIQAIRGYSMGLNEFQPSVYVIDKESKKITNQHESGQRYGYYGAEKGRSVKKELPYSLLQEPTLNMLEITRIANITKDLETQLNNNKMKIEFAVEDERAFIIDLKEIKEVEMKKQFKEDETEFEDEQTEEDTSEETDVSEQESETAEEETSGETESSEADELEDDSDEESETTDEIEDTDEETTDDSSLGDESDESGLDDLEKNESESNEETGELEDSSEDLEDDGTSEETDEGIEADDSTEKDDDAETEDESAEETSEDESSEESEEADEVSEQESETAEEETTDEDTSEETDDSPEEESEYETADEQEETKDETEPYDEEEKDEVDDADDDREEQLNDLFDQYSEKVNSLLAELKEEALRILKQ